MIGLTMQTLDNSITVLPKRTTLGRFKLTSQQGHGVPNPAWIPVANETMRRIAATIGGFPLSSIGEMADIPMTAHFIGGRVEPRSPAVPQAAPAALHLPATGPRGRPPTRLP